jgi:hypothetical protein
VSGLIRCAACGRLHKIAALIPHPDRPHVRLCPVKWRGLRITRAEREAANRIIRIAFADPATANGQCGFPDDGPIAWPTDADAADEWWTS